MEFKDISQLASYLQVERDPQLSNFQNIRAFEASSTTTYQKRSLNTVYDITNQNQLSQGGIFVGDLSLFFTEDNILQLFAPFGPVLTARIRRAENGISLMHGFVILENVEKANAAVNILNGQEFMGRNIK